MPTTRIVKERSGALASPAAEATKPIRCTPACLPVGDHVKRAVADAPGRTVSLAPAGSAEAAAISTGTETGAAVPGDNAAASVKLRVEPTATLYCLPSRGVGALQRTSPT